MRRRLYFSLTGYSTLRNFRLLLSFVLVLDSKWYVVSKLVSSSFTLILWIVWTCSKREEVAAAVGIPKLAANVTICDTSKVRREGEENAKKQHPLGVNLMLSKGP